MNWINQPRCLRRVPFALSLISLSVIAVAAAGEPEETLPVDVCPVELGRVPWLRDFETAQRQARETGKPLLFLFQEVPGCSTCQNFGKGPLSHPLIVDAAGEFVPACVDNSVRDRTRPDARLLKQFDEPAWNNPVVRFTDAQGKDIRSSDTPGRRATDRVYQNGGARHLTPEFRTCRSDPCTRCAGLLSVRVNVKFDMEWICDIR